MASPIAQASFIGGIVAPPLRARVDLQRYTQGLADLLNFTVHPHGGVANRPGSDRVGLAKSQDGSLVRLIRFAPSAEEQYILELGELYLHVWSGTERVTTPDFPLIVTNDTTVNVVTEPLLNNLSPDHGPTRSQSFITPAGAIDIGGISIRVGRSGSNPPIMRVAIFDDNAGVPGAEVPGLGASDFVGPASATFPTDLIPGFTEWTVPVSVPISAGTRYHLMVFSEGPDGADHNYVLATPGDNYPDGSCFFNFLGTWTERPSLDLNFNVFGGPGSLLEIVTPYTAAQVQRLVTTQSVDVMTITDPSHTNAALELKRFTPNIWTLTPLTAFVNFGSPINVGVVPGLIPGGTPTREWQYAVSGVLGSVESLPTISAVVVVGSNVSALDPVPLSFEEQALEHVDYYNIYKGLNGTFGFIGIVRVPQPHSGGTFFGLFLDENFAPDYTDQPRQGFNPFTIAGGRKPAVAAYFQQRLAFANWQDKPDTIALSETADYKTFDVSVPRTPDDAIEATLASGGFDEIRALVPLADLLIFTAAAEYVANGSNGVVGGDPILFDASPRSHRGSQWLQPIVAGDIVLFYDAAGHIREWVFDQNTNSFPASDLTLLASHLFTNRYVVSWAYTQAPHSVVWLVLDDGTLLTLTYLREQSVAAWARHDTQGRVRSIVQARVGLADCLYMTVERDGFGVNGDETRTFVERILARDPATSHFLDCSITVSDRPGGTIKITGQPGVGNMMGVEFLLPLSTATPAIGDWIVVTVASGDFRFKLTTSLGLNLWEAEALDNFPPLFEGIALSSWAFARSLWGGFDALAGKTVGVIADGDPHAEVVVGQDGFITLERHATDVTAGLSYVSRLETLKLNVQSGDIRTKQKVVNRVFLDVLDTRGAFVGEQREDGLPIEFEELRQSDLARPVAQSTRLTVGTASSWNLGGAIVIEQRQPLPLEILSITPEVSISGG